MRTVTIRIGTLAAGGYPVRLETDDGQAPVAAILPRDLGGAESQPVNAIRTTLLQADGPTPELDAVGRRLHDLLVQGPIGERLHALSRQSLRILLDVADDDLRRLPWELMSSRQSRLATRRDRPLARVAPGYPGEPGMTVAWPLRLLVVVGISSSDAGAKVDEELAALPEAFRCICGLVDVECLHLPSRERVSEVCRTMRPHVLHVIAHGGLDHDDAGAFLLIEDGESGTPWQWTAGDIPEDLPELRPRLVVLNACRSAEIAQQDAAWGVADAFLELGVAAVIGMQGDISGPAAAGFSRGLYGALADGSPVDVALTQARLEMIRRTSKLHRDWALPSLVTAVAPDEILSTTPPLAPAVRNQLQAEISGFIDRSESRREVWRKLSLGPEPDPAEADALAVVGPPEIGKSMLLKWCINASALNGGNVAYVNLNSTTKLPELRILGLIAEALADSLTHGARNAAAFDRWLEGIDRILGAAATPSEPEGRYHRAIPKDPPEKADEAVFSMFAEALREAADGEGLVIALDHVNERNLTEATWTRFLVPRLIKEIILHRLEPVRMIIVASEPYRAALTGPNGGIASLPLEQLPGPRLRELVRVFLLYRGYDLAGVDAFLRELSLPEVPDDWPPSHLPGIEVIAEVKKVKKAGSRE